MNVALKHVLAIILGALTFNLVLDGVTDEGFFEWTIMDYIDCINSQRIIRA